MPEALQFATSLDDPRLEADLLPRAISRRALLVAGGGCAALSLARRYPEIAFSAFDPSATQLDHVRAKMKAAEQLELGRLNVEDDDASGLNSCGVHEGILRVFRKRVEATVAPRTELLAFFRRELPLTELDAMVRRWTADPAWSTACSTSLGALRDVLGTEEARHLPGTWAEHAQKALERGLRRDSAPENPFLSLALLGMYGVEREPYYARNGGPCSLELVHGTLAAVPKLDSFDLISLGSSLDLATDDELAATVQLLAKALRPGAAVFIRQLGCARSIRPQFEGPFWFDSGTGRRFAERDRSLLNHRFEVAVKR